VAIEKGLPWRTVPEVTVMLGDGRRETSTKLFFIVKLTGLTGPARSRTRF
jgi:hypothetical protein